MSRTLEIPRVKYALIALALYLFAAAAPVAATPLFVSEVYLHIGIDGYFLNNDLLTDTPDDLVFSNARVGGFATGFTRGTAAGFAQGVAYVDLDVPEIFVAAQALGAAAGVGSRAIAIAGALGAYKITNNSANTYDIAFNLFGDFNYFAEFPDPGDVARVYASLAVDFFGGSFDLNTFRLTLAPGQSSIVQGAVETGGDAYVTPEPATSALIGAGMLFFGVAYGLKRKRQRRN